MNGPSFQLCTIPSHSAWDLLPRCTTLCSRVFDTLFAYVARESSGEIGINIVIGNCWLHLWGISTFYTTQKNITQQLCRTRITKPRRTSMRSSFVVRRSSSDPSKVGMYIWPSPSFRPPGQCSSGTAARSERAKGSRALCACLSSLQAKAARWTPGGPVLHPSAVQKPEFLGLTRGNGVDLTHLPKVTGYQRG